jgi:phosphoglycerate dehydrogenase-like enzyme
MRIAVLDDYHRRAGEFADWDSLGAGTEVTFFADPMPPARLSQELVGFDVLVLMRERTAFPREVLAGLPDLKLLITTGMRNASVDAAYLRERGIVYCGTGMATGLEQVPDGATSRPPGVPSTVEVAWALILALCKRVTIEDRAIRAGRWQTGMPLGLAGATLGLAGLGRLGSAMVGPARAFGMEVIAWSSHLDDARAAEVGVERVSFDELLERADVLSIHLVLGDRTRGLFGQDELSRCKPGAVLINTSRGPIVDQAAMIASLRSGLLGGAGLDVYDQEPLPAGHELLSLDNVVLLPHLGYVTEPAFRAMYGDAVQDIAAWIGGEPIRLIEESSSPAAP